jgi:hypothetical protein
MGVVGYGDKMGVFAGMSTPPIVLCYLLALVASVGCSKRVQHPELFLPLTDTDDRALATHLGSRTDWESIVLNATLITDAGLVYLSRCIGLRDLDIRYTKVTDVGLSQLAELKCLQHLSLDGTGVTDAGLAHLAGLKYLSQLSIRKTGVTDAGLAHLTGLERLVFLDISETGVTDAGLPSLFGLRSLRGLDISRSKVTAQGVSIVRSNMPWVDIEEEK